MIQMQIFTNQYTKLSYRSFVRLGVFDINFDSDEPIQNVRVTRFQHHPNYSDGDRKNDIAILHLKQDVDLTGKSISKMI